MLCIHRAWQINSVGQMLYRSKTVLINIFGGAKSKIQPLYKVFNNPFKNYVWELFEKHIGENDVVCVEGTLSVAKRLILTNTWVADVGEKLKGNQTWSN